MLLRKYLRAVRRDPKNLSGLKIAEPTAPRRYPKHLSPVVRVILGIATPKEEWSCRELSHHLSASDWAIVYDQVQRYSAKKSERSIGGQKRRKSSRKLEMVQHHLEMVRGLSH